MLRLNSSCIQEADTNEIFSNNTSQSFYDSLRRLLSKECTDLNDSVVIENAFMETTRDGQVLQPVRLALTSKAFVVASRKDEISTSQDKNRCDDDLLLDIITLYPLQIVKLLVFKRSKRLCLKAMYSEKRARYFELPQSQKMKILWKLWCCYTKELNNSKRKWPFSKTLDAAATCKSNDAWTTDCIRIYVVENKEDTYQRPRWTDKDLYLGSKREAEDNKRPRPLPGLGKTEEIKLLYLKPRYFGCWEQSEHWVQCGESSPEFRIS